MSTVEVKGKRISYQAPPGFEAGDRKGHTVLLIHGATDNHKIWYQQYEALSRDHTPVAVDLPGHFESEGPGIDNAQAYREFIEDFSQATRLAPFVFCGHSMGGSMALDFAVHHPDMLQAAHGDAISNTTTPTAATPAHLGSPVIHCDAAYPSIADGG